MNIKQIRKQSGMTQKDFCNEYHIPIQTLKQWESDENSTSHRNPPEYVEYLLEIAVSKNRKDKATLLIEASHESAFNANHWFRYLRKEFDKKQCKLNEFEINKLLKSNDLTMFQKITFKRAIQSGTPTNLYVAGLNQQAKTNMLGEIMRRYQND